MLNKKNIVIAVLCSLIATYLAYAYLDELEARVTSPIDMGTVVVASSDIAQGTIIEYAMVEQLQIPCSAIAPRAVQQIDEVLGKTVIENLTCGEQIIETRIGHEKEVKTFVDRVSEGLRAVTVSVSEDCTFSGLLRPGDRIDIIGTLSEYGSVERTAYTYISDVEVLAVGDEYRLYTNSEISRDDDSLFQFQPSLRARTVTLALTPKDAELIVLLEQHGHMKFALRSHDASEDEVNETDTCQQSLNGVVELIRGTKLESIQIEW
jgi:pilus assembly protein CpaB